MFNISAILTPEMWYTHDMLSPEAFLRNAKA